MKNRLLITAALFMLALAPAQAQLFGPSDEEVAAAKAHEDGQDARIQQNAQASEATNARLQQVQEQDQAQIRDLNDRVRSLTDSLARATGANEELSHQLALLNARIDQQQKDFSYRLCTLSAQSLGADPNTLNCAAGGAGNSAPAVRPQAQVAPGAALPPLGGAQNNNFGGAQGNNFGDDSSTRGRAPGTLGTLSASGPPLPRLGAPDNGAGADSRQFDSAMGLLGRAQYNEAAAGFRAYADTHPDDDNLSAQSIYWVGRIAQMQQDNAGAARAFAEELKKYPKSSVAPDSMLRMGQTLVAQGQGANGCTAFRAVTKKQYPDASQSTIDAAVAARKANNCR